MSMSTQDEIDALREHIKTLESKIALYETNRSKLVALLADIFKIARVTHDARMRAISEAIMELISEGEPNKS